MRGARHPAIALHRDGAPYELFSEIQKPCRASLGLDGRVARPHTGKNKNKSRQLFADGLKLARFARTAEGGRPYVTN